MDSEAVLQHHSRTQFVSKNTEERVVICAVCGLSMVGALLIILSYLCFRSLRTRAREILLHISIMDFGVAASNLIGAAIYFDQYYNKPECYGPGIHVDPRVCPVSSAIGKLCITQAFFAGYFTHGSILWTLALSIYLYFLIVHHSTKRAKYALWIAYPVCYTVPFLLNMWLLTTGRLGYSPYQSEGWCALVGMDPLTMQQAYIVTVIGYDMWIYLAMVLVPILSLSVHLHIKYQLEDIPQFYGSKRLQLALQKLDYKFFFIPVAFVILRMWSCIEFIIYTYVKTDYSVPDWVAVLLIYLSGIGDSGQGLVNAFLYVIFTKPVRMRITELFCKFCHRICKKRSSSFNVQKPSNRTPVSGVDSHHTFHRSEISSDKTPWQTR